VDSWPRVPLGELLLARKEFVRIDDVAIYKRCRVQLHARGVVLRDVVRGSEIRTKSQQVCNAGELLVAEIDAKVGGYGIVPPELDGAIVSGHYFLYQLKDAARLDWRYLELYLHAPAFQVQVEAQGSTNYAAIRPTDVLKYEIPLPLPQEQQRIVECVEAIAGRLAKAQALRRESVTQARELMRCAADRELNRLAADNCRVSTVRECEELVTSGPRNFASQYAPAGVRFYRAQDIGTNGSVHDAKTVMVQPPEGTTRRAFTKPGDVLVVITGATIGRVALLRETDPPGIVSQHVGLVRLNRDRVFPPFFLYALRSQAWTGGQLAAAKYGQGKPGLNLTNLRNLSFPLPPLEEQMAVVERCDRVAARAELLLEAQAASSAELDALLPATLNLAFNGSL
jgi:type I restriction enzyme S subunit